MKAATGLVGAFVAVGAAVTGVVWWVQHDGTLPAAPDFTVVTLENETFHLAGQRGNVVVLQFFATWCVTCETTARSLNQSLGAWNTSQVKVLTLSSDPSVPPADVDAWRDARGYTWPFAIDTDQVTLKYEVFALGRLVIIDPQGRISFSKEGTVTSAELVREVAQALRQVPADPMV